MRQGSSTQFQSFLRQADAALSSSFGVPYSEIQPYVEAVPGAPKAAEAMRTGIQPEAFAAEVAIGLALVPVTKAGNEAAREANKRVAALAEFASENPDWSFGTDGAVYKVEDSGLSRLQAGRDGDAGPWGFLAAHSPEGYLDGDDMGRAIPVGAAFEALAGAPDIGDAVTRLEERLAPATPRLG